MKINAKQKGSSGERALAEWLRDNGCPSARRTQQYCGTEGTSDVTVTELFSWHIEHKATKSANIPPSKLAAWLQQVGTDCPAGKLPVIINTPNNRSRIAIIPAITVEALRAHVTGFTQVFTLYVDTLGGNACDFENELRRINAEWVTRHIVCGETCPSWCTLIGNVKTKLGVQHYLVLRASDWLALAKDYQAIAPTLEAKSPATV